MYSLIFLRENDYLLRGSQVIQIFQEGFFDSQTVKGIVRSYRMDLSGEKRGQFVYSIIQFIIQTFYAGFSLNSTRDLKQFRGLYRPKTEK